MLVTAGVVFVAGSVFTWDVLKEVSVMMPLCSGVGFLGAFNAFVKSPSARTAAAPDTIAVVFFNISFLFCFCFSYSSRLARTL